MVTLKLDSGPATDLTPVFSASGLQARTQAGTDFTPDETSLVKPVLVLGPGLFDENGDLVLGSSENYFGSAVVSTNGPVHKFDWPDFSGVVELLVSESTRNLVSKYRLPGEHAAKKKKKKTKEEHLMDGKCRTDRAPRSLFSRSFHILAAAFIGTFLVIVVLRKSGRGSYWW
ncbi:MAG: hypothetical protein ACYTF8_08815 [Planctomycetota bacterium]